MSKNIDIPVEYHSAYQLFLQEALGQRRFFEQAAELMIDEHKAAENFAELRVEIVDRLHQLVGAAGFLNLDDVKSVCQGAEKKLPKEDTSNQEMSVLAKQLIYLCSTLEGLPEL